MNSLFSPEATAALKHISSLIGGYDIIRQQLRKHRFFAPIEELDWCGNRLAAFCFNMSRPPFRDIYDVRYVVSRCGLVVRLAVERSVDVPEATYEDFYLSGLLADICSAPRETDLAYLVLRWCEILIGKAIPDELELELDLIPSSAVHPELLRRLTEPRLVRLAIAAMSDGLRLKRVASNLFEVEDLSVLSTQLSGCYGRLLLTSLDIKSRMAELAPSDAGAAIIRPYTPNQHAMAC